MVRKYRIKTIDELRNTSGAEVTVSKRGTIIRHNSSDSFFLTGYMNM